MKDLENNFDLALVSLTCHHLVCYEKLTTLVVSIELPVDKTLVRFQSPIQTPSVIAA